MNQKAKIRINGYKAALFEQFAQWFPLKAQQLPPEFRLKMGLYRLLAELGLYLRSEKSGSFNYETSPAVNECNEILREVPSSKRVTLLWQVFRPYSVFALIVAHYVPFDTHQVEEIFIHGLKLGKEGDLQLAKYAIELDYLPTQRVIDLVYEHVTEENDLAYAIYKIAFSVQRKAHIEDQIYFDTKLREACATGVMKINPFGG